MKDRNELFSELKKLGYNRLYYKKLADGLTVSVESPRDNKRLELKLRGNLDLSYMLDAIYHGYKRALENY
jgi:hypothetical protein